MDKLFNLISLDMIQSTGFAGFALIELFVIIWCIKTIIRININVTDALNKLSDTIAKKQSQEERLCKQMEEVRDQLLKRPCIAKEL